MRPDHDREEWLSCPECGSGRIDVEQTIDYESSRIFECRNCGERDAYWL